MDNLLNDDLPFLKFKSIFLYNFHIITIIICSILTVLPMSLPTRKKRKLKCWFLKLPWLHVPYGFWMQLLYYVHILTDYQLRRKLMFLVFLCRLCLSECGLSAEPKEWTVILLIVVWNKTDMIWNALHHMNWHGMEVDISLAFVLFTSQLLLTAVDPCGVLNKERNSPLRNL